jgi:hypothetical protein
MVIPKIIITLTNDVGTTTTEDIDIRKKSDIPKITPKDNLGIMVFKKPPPCIFSLFLTVPKK